MQGDSIVDIEIHDCMETTILGTTMVDEDDMLYGFGESEKDPYGLKRRFSDFMNNMVNVGPYLDNPKEVILAQEEWAC